MFVFLDNPPYCSKFRYKESVPEDAPLGTLVFKVETKDVDENEESRVRYFLTGRGAEDFSIDSTSGKLLSFFSFSCFLFFSFFYCFSFNPVIYFYLLKKTINVVLIFQDLWHVMPAKYSNPTLSSFLSFHFLAFSSFLSFIAFFLIL